MSNERPWGRLFPARQIYAGRDDVISKLGSKIAFYNCNLIKNIFKILSGNYEFPQLINWKQFWIITMCNSYITPNNLFFRPMWKNKVMSSLK